MSRQRKVCLIQTLGDATGMALLFSNRYLRAFILGSSALAIVSCGTEPATLGADTSAARSITELFSVVFAIAAVIFVLVEGLLVYFVWRQRRRGESGFPVQIHGNTALEVTWTLIPALILLVIFVFTVRTMIAVYNPPAPQELNVRVISHQWWWEFQYPDLQIVTANELQVPVGAVINLQLNSADVIHSFWAPQLAGKTDTIPGRTNQLWLKVDKPGVYPGRCAEFCGVQHANMRFRVIALPRAEFDAWVKQMQTPPAPVSGLQAQGRQVFESKPCVGCHTIQGTQGVGQTGPNLTHFGSRTTIAAETLDNTRENLALWLKNPQAIKPGNIMPNLNLSSDEINALVEYLASLK